MVREFLISLDKFALCLISHMCFSTGESVFDRGECARGHYVIPQFVCSVHVLRSLLRDLCFVLGFTVIYRLKGSSVHSFNVIFSVI